MGSRKGSKNKNKIVNSISERHDETNNYTQPMNNTTSIEILESIYIGKQFPLKNSITTVSLIHFFYFLLTKKNVMKMKAVQKLF